MYIADIFINKADFGYSHGQIYSIELQTKLKERHRATLLLLIYVHFFRREEMSSLFFDYDKCDDVNSISQSFRSWVVMFRLRKPLAIFRHILYAITGIAPYSEGKTTLKCPCTDNFYISILSYPILHPASYFQHPKYCILHPSSSILQKILSNPILSYPILSNKNI